MTDHHDHHHGTREQGAHGVQPPPSDAELAQYETQGMRGSESVPLHFFDGPGPMNVRRVPRRRIRIRDGTYRTCTWEFRWYLDTVEGTTRTKALRRIYDVILDPRGWTRAGVHWKRVLDPALANIRVSVLPQAKTVCGAGAAGCFSWGGGRTPLAEMGVEYIDRPGPWASLTNMEMLGHGTFKADDMYFAIHQPHLIGVMGTWQAMARAGYMPTDEEVADTVTWLAGKTPPDRIHWHN